MDSSVTPLQPAADTHHSDEGLMLRYAAGDATAFDCLYERHRGPVYRFFLRQLPADQANDCFQTLWLKLIRSRRRYRASAPLRAFLFTLAHNVLMDHYRHNRRLVTMETENLEMLADTTLADGDSDTILTQTETAELADRLRTLIGALPFQQREAWLLQQEASLSHEEIASITRTSPEGVKSRLRYARARLKAGLKAHVEQN